MKQKQILVTGSRGFLGKHLINYLLNKTKELDIRQVIGVNHAYGKSLSQLDKEIYEEAYCCLENESWVKCLFDTVQPDIIFHLAAKQGKDIYSFHNNVNSTLYLTEYKPKNCKFVFASSSTVYGDLSNKNTSGTIEEKFHYSCSETDQTKPTNLYGAAKLAGESIVGAQDTKNLILRFCSMIGTGINFGALHDIISKVNSGVDKLELWGIHPGSIKPYLHVDDAISALIELGFENYSGIYNISPADNLSIGEMADLIMSIININKEKVFLGPPFIPKGDNRVVKINNDKAVSLGWTPKYKTSTEAIKQSVRDIINETKKNKDTT